jgi:penicillin G amidase
VTLPLLTLLTSLVVASPSAGVASEALTMDGQPVTLRRDSYGVPHIIAPSERAAYWADGYAIAEDRMAQMEKYRRAARGELAELVGPSALSSDEETRRESYTDAEREAMLGQLDPEVRASLEAYADGVNAFLKARGDDLPPAVRKLGVPIRPWRAVDSMAIGEMMARRFGAEGGGELRNMLVLSFLKSRFKDAAPRVFDDLLWRNDPQAPTTIPRDESPTLNRRLTQMDADGKGRLGRLARVSPVGMSKPICVHPRLAAVLFGAVQCRQSAPVELPAYSPAAARRAMERANRSEVLRVAAALKLPTTWGSYAIVVSGRKMAGGAPVLVGGPQMGFSTPQIAHEVHLSAPGLDVVGMGFAGVPGVLIGHNPRLAWTTTTGDADEEDIFVETLNPADPEEYRFNGGWRRMEKRIETIAVRGGTPVSCEVFRSVHGPVLEWDREHHRAYSKQMAYWKREAKIFEAVYRFNRAGTAREFGDAVARIATSHNWFCATQVGDIGYWYSGRQPIRASGIDTRFPTPGTGEYEWRGYLPFARMPQIVNPRQGFLANWNSKPAVWWDHGDSPVWGEVFRASRIAQLLKAKPVLTVDDVKSILPDIGLNEPAAAALKPLLLRAARKRSRDLDATERAAVAQLAAWDNHAPEGSIGKTIFDAYVVALRTRIFGDEFGGFPDQSLLVEALPPTLLLHALQGKAASVPLSRDYLNGQSADTVMLSALKNALAGLTKQRGPALSAWRYSQGEIDLKPLPGIPRYSRGTYIQVIELSRPTVFGESILLPGQSEDPASPHFSDQRELASWWGYKPMIGDRE